MMYLVLAGIILFSSLIAYQDFKTRSVSILNLIGFSLFSFAYGVLQFQLKQTCMYFLFNLIFISFQASVLALYYFIKYRNFKTLFASIGGADIWVIVSLAFSFDLQVFIFFICASFIVATIYYFTINKFLSKLNKEVPLAGVLVLSYVSYIVVKCLV